MTLNAGDLSDYLKNLPKDGKLRVVLLDVSGYLNATNLPSANSLTYNPLSFFMTTEWHDLYVDYFDGRFSLGQLVSARESNQNIGLPSVLEGYGYRNDGSLDRGSTSTIQADRADISSQISSEVSLVDSDIKNGKSDNINYGPSLSESNISEIENFLSIANSRNIYVIGYLSPYALEIYKEMQSRQDAYGATYREAPAALSKIFEKYGYDFYDMRDLSTIGSSDSELYDSEHPTEKAAMLKLLIYLSDKRAETLGVCRYSDFGSGKLFPNRIRNVKLKHATGCSIAVVYAHGVGAVRVRLPAARKFLIFQKGEK